MLDWQLCLSWRAGSLLEILEKFHQNACRRLSSFPFKRVSMFDSMSALCGNDGRIRVLELVSLYKYVCTCCQRASELCESVSGCVRNFLFTIPRRKI